MEDAAPVLGAAFSCLLGVLAEGYGVLRKEGRAPMVSFLPSRSPYPSSGRLWTCCKPARSAPFGVRRTKACKAAAGIGGLSGGGFRFCLPPLSPVAATCSVSGVGGAAVLRSLVSRRTPLLFGCAVSRADVKKRWKCSTCRVFANCRTAETGFPFSRRA